MLALIQKSPETNVDPEALAIHLLCALSTSTHRVTLDELAAELGVRRGDVRRTLSSLHREGFVDVLRMRLTLTGFTVARAHSASPLPAIRRACRAASFAA